MHHLTRLQKAKGSILAYRFQLNWVLREDLKIGLAFRELSGVFC